ncbi:hypothetical protein HOY80DRAFT_1001152 [Tuber brumale]|nr:hypothetical protein HOY80DRAFT_1001152 [Tuber brumale]
MLTPSRHSWLRTSSFGSLPYLIIRATSSSSSKASTPSNGKKTYTPRNLPLSPIEDPKKYVKYSKAHPKAGQPLKNAPLPDSELRLTKNPYAHMLAQPVRQEVEFHRRVPRAFLIRFKQLVHPETRETWIVPDGLRQTDDQRGRVRKGKWVMGNINMMHSLKKKNAKKLIGDEKSVFPEDLAESVRDLMRKRVFDEVFDVAQRGGDKCFVRGEVVEEMDGIDEIGCVLDWELEEGARGVVADTGEVNEVTGRVQRKEILVRVNGRLCPVHHMRVMLGEEVAGKIKDLWELDEGVTRVGLLRREGTLQLEIWLMKMRAYMGIW